MAIIKMKRLRLMAVRSRKEDLLRELIRHGCVEFSEIEDEIEGSEAEGLLAREDSGIMALRSDQTAVNHAIELLHRYAPAKGKLLAPKPEVERETLLDESGLAEALKTAEYISSKDDRIKRISAEESRQRGIIESLVPWLPLDLPLESEGTERAAVLMGSVPAKTVIADVEKGLAQTSEEAELFRISGDKSQHYLLVVCIRESLQEVQEALRSFNFTAASFSGMKGTAQECTAQAEAALKELAEEKETCEKEIKDEASKAEELKLASDRLSTSICMAEAEGRLYGTDSVLMMEGWMPADREEELSKVFDEFECAWETRDPEEEEYPEVPVKLKNNAVTNSLNMVTNMYSLPAYGSVDANPYMAPFFILFYGLMMADMGYGILMIIAAAVAMTKMKPQGGGKVFSQLLLYCGISTFLMGALTGGFFGDVPLQLAQVFGSSWQGLPALFSPVGNSEMVLYGAMVLGVIHLNVGMIVSFNLKRKRGQLMDGLFEEGPLWIILLGGILLALGMLDIVPALTMPGKIVLIVGVVLLLFGAGRHSKGFFGKIMAAFSCIYDQLTGWFGDILSYSRIMALMLAGSVVAQVFNSIAVMPLAGGVNVLSVIAFLLIFVVGHALNFGLNLLGCFVHDLRLQCLEFFGKFYEDGGKPFEPLEVKSKYVSAKDN